MLFSLVVKVGTFLARSYCIWKFSELVLVCDLSLLSNWDHSIGCLRPYFPVVSDVETGALHFLGAVASSRVLTILGEVKEYVDSFQVEFFQI